LKEIDILPGDALHRDDVDDPRSFAPPCSQLANVFRVDVQEFGQPFSPLRR